MTHIQNNIHAWHFALPPLLVPKSHRNAHRPSHRALLILVDSNLFYLFISTPFPFPLPFPCTVFPISLHCYTTPSSHVSFSEPLGIDDGGHMTKGAAPGHVCVSTALPDTMTRTHATWLRMLNKKHSWYICLIHQGDKIQHVSNGSHLVGLCSVQPAKAHRSNQWQKYHKANLSTDCFSRYLKPFETWDVFSLQGVLFVVRGRCFVHFVWASAVAYPDGVKPAHFLSADSLCFTSHPVRWLASSITTSIPLSLKNLLWKKILMLLFCDVCHLYRKKRQNPSFYYLFLYINWPCQVIFCKDFCQSVWLLWSIWTCLPAVNLDMFWYQFRCFGEWPLSPLEEMTRKS